MKFEFANRWRMVKLAQSRVGAGVLSVMLAGAMLMGAAGCAAGQGQVSASAERAGSVTATSTQTAEGSTASTADSTAIVVNAIDESLYDLDYTDRDKDPSYDEASAVKIELQGTSASASGEGVQVDGSTVTITAEGVYVLEGTLDDGQIVVDAPEDAKVQLVLNGAHVTNADGSAIYVKQADKCFITLAEGSENSVSDGADYALADGADEPDAAIFSDCDLTLQGSGKLQVTAQYNDGIKTKDDLVVTGGTYEVTAAADGLVGKDSVKVADGTISVKAGGDAVKSSKDDDQSKGFVSIDGGTLKLDAGDKGVKAATYLRVEEGATIDVTASDDALHSDGVARVDGGNITIDSGDDAVHAEYVLEVNGGTIDVTSCVEGYEAQEITVNGGDSNIVSSDDGINASTAGTTSSNANEPFAQGGASSGAAPSGEMPGGGMSSGAAPIGEMPGGGMASGAAPSGEAPAMPDGVSQGQMGGQGGRMDQGGQGSRGDQSGSMGSMGAMGQGGMGGQGGGMMDADENCVLTINGGTINLEVGGDALDSNGHLYLNGGEVYISGPTNSGNGSIDYGVSASVSGGTLIAAGASGMAETFTDGTQAFALVQASGNAGDQVSVTDSNGNELASFTATLPFQCVIVTAPGMQDGATYQLVVNGQSTEFTASTQGGQAGMGGMSMGPR